jgi:hypothetical protein
MGHAGRSVRRSVVWEAFVRAACDYRRPDVGPGSHRREEELRTAKKRPYVTAAQFEADPRAKAIRDTSLEVLDVLDRLLHDAGMDKQAGYASLERLNGRLIELGVQKNMCTHLEQSAYHDPLTMARYTAGQVVIELGKRVFSEQEVIPVIAEHAQHSGDSWQALIMPGRDLPKPIRGYLVMDRLIWELCWFFDAES